MSSVLEKLDLGLADEMVAARGAALRLVTFRLAGQLFGVELASALVVADMAKIAVVPGAPRHVLGVMNHRGGLVPVVDLRPLLSLPAAPPRHDGKVLILDSDASEKGVGFTIDTLEDIVETTADEVQPPPEGLGGPAAQFVSGTVSLDADLVALLDLRGVDGRGI